MLCTVTEALIGLAVPVPEIIDPVSAKTSSKHSFLMTENEHFGLVFAKTGSINSGTGLEQKLQATVNCSSICNLHDVMEITNGKPIQLSV
jgi:hypothetical protein